MLIVSYDTKNPSDLRRAWDSDGWMLIPSALDPNLIDNCVTAAHAIYPTGAQFAENPSRYTDLGKSQFSAMTSFPWDDPRLSLVCLHDIILDAAAAILDTEEPLLYQAQLWAKYHSATSYDQTHHRDYAKNTMLAPLGTRSNDFVEIFIYLTDVAAPDGPTALIPRPITAHLPLEPARYTEGEMPLLYRHESLAIGPRGSVLLYSGEVFHRATALTRPGGIRLGLKLAFKHPAAHWVGYHVPLRLGFEPAWGAFVAAASPRQLRAVGFPVRPTDLIDDQCFAGVCQRYGASVANRILSS